MKRILLLFLILPLFVRADWDRLFSEEEDLSLCHQVNVISGHLNLCFQDAVVQGSKQLSLLRTYTSAGALERSCHHVDDKLESLRGGWLIQGGWNLLPHANLFVEPAEDLKDYQIYLPERNGNFLCYQFSHWEKKGSILCLKPKLKAGQCSGHLSARTNPRNNLLKYNPGAKRATLSLPDGTVCEYRGSEELCNRNESSSKYGFNDGDLTQDNVNNSFRRGPYYLRLVSEISPSQHKTKYSYDEKDRLHRISLRNASGSKLFAAIDFALFKTGNDKKKPFHFRAATSDKKTIDYRSINYKEKNYLNDVQSTSRAQESSHYLPGRSGTGARIDYLNLGGNLQFSVEYFAPKTKKEGKKWALKPHKKPFHIDRVKRLIAPVGPSGESLTIAKFSYQKHSTDVRDIDQILTRYHHDEEKLALIEYFNEKDQLVSCLKFLWKDSFLQAKVFLNAQGQPLFSRTFQYDSLGNVTEEVLFGNLTGLFVGPFFLKADGSLSGAEKYTKRYAYLPQFNVPILEEEEEGLTYAYAYKAGTNLLTSKLTYEGQKIRMRAFFIYDADNLLSAEICDDGVAADLADLSKVTERQIKRYTLHPTTGLCLNTVEAYLDLRTNKEVLLKKIEYTYSERNIVTSETIYDAKENLSYTLYTDYDAFGHVIRKTTASSQENAYSYDANGNLLTAQEVGLPKKIYSYSPSGRPISCQEINSAGESKTTLSHYDSKGRLLSQTDAKGNTTVQCYDSFGRCIQTQFPDSQDENGKTYSPIIHFSYDLQGNLTSTTTPAGATAQTFYNLFRKPIREIQADGNAITHLYNTNGTLAETTYPDGTEVQYTYDLFQRMTAKSTDSADGKRLSRESWEYSTFHLVAYTDSRGLKTTYTYDGAGRKSREVQEGREILYTYDSLSFLEKTSDGDLTHVKRHAPDGLVLEEWTEDLFGRVENQMSFFYNKENRKEKAIRITSQGEASDDFAYDAEGRLTAHTDPLGAVTQFIYQETKNSLNQRVLQKATIDPLKNTTIETYDALNHLVSCEKQDKKSKTVSDEHFFYDRSGNRAKRVSTVYLENTPKRTICTEWEYDALGRLIKQVEAGEKTTLYEIDSRGRVVEKILPSGITLYYSYDGIDRLTLLKSSDSTVHYQYSYGKGPDSIEIADRISNTRLKRTYNLFGELIQEINPLNLSYSWAYDDHGRCTQFNLPDSSSITYDYTGAHLTSVQREDEWGRTLYTHEYLDFDPNGHVQEESLIFNLGTIHTQRDLLERVSTQETPWFDQKIAYGPSQLVTQIDNSLFEKTDYQYDPLNQLLQEGKKKYLFDSFGNPASAIVNNCNQILSTANCTLSYDSDGNPLKRTISKDTYTYTYDALGRLLTIANPQQKVQYSYDPLSRLLSKKTEIYYFCGKRSNTHLYLYDQEKEIGTLSEDGDLLEVKVLGLGLKGDIGAAIAIEVKGDVFAPMHDFNGSIIALISSSGDLEETYEIDAFGKEITPENPISPWRFCSKRNEGGFIFFGKRFYDPVLGRWLTPDPAGFADSPNLYVYVLNSPLNRLDLFGLYSHSWTNRPDEATNIDVPIASIRSSLDVKDLIFCKGFIGETRVDWVVSCGHWHKLQFSTEEIKKGVVNIVDHFSEILPKEGAIVGLITWQNGMNTTFKEFSEMSKSIVGIVPEGPLCIGLHNPTEGIFNDYKRVVKEQKGQDTPTVQRTRQMFTTMIDLLPNINPNLIWVHIQHSEGGLIGKLGIEGMTDDRRKHLATQLCVIGLGSAEPMPSKYALKATDFYSEKDRVTKRFAEPFLNDPNYDIRILPCATPSSDRGFLTGDHAFSGETYQGALVEGIREHRIQYGIYDAKSR